MINNIKSFPITTIEYFVVFLIVLRCNGLFNPPIFKVILQTCIFILFIYGFLNIKKYHNNLSVLLLFLTSFISITSLFLIFNFYVYHYSLTYIYTFLLQPVMLIVYIYSFVDNDEIDKSLLFKLENVILLLAIISLVFWGLATIGMKPNSYIISNWTVHGQIIPGYFHLSYFSQGKIEFLGFEMLRNTGLFNEAPMYSYVLSIALLIELFMKNSKVLNYRSIILIVVIITTTSTTGIIVSIMALLYSILITHNNKLSLVLISIFLIPIVLIVIRSIIISKIGNGTNIYSSFNIRVDDIVASFNAWKQHLIIGNGINNNNSIIEYMNPWRLMSKDYITIGLSTGFMSILAYGGIFLISFYTIPTILIMHITSKFKGIAIFSFILFIFAMISTTNLYILLLSYFWAVSIYDKEKSFY